MCKYIKYSYNHLQHPAGSTIKIRREENAGFWENLAPLAHERSPCSLPCPRYLRCAGIYHPAKEKLRAVPHLQWSLAERFGYSLTSFSKYRYGPKRGAIRAKGRIHNDGTAPGRI